MWQIPLFDITLGQKELDAVHEVIRSGWLTMGEVTANFEKLFAEFLGVNHALAVSSGTAALHLANMALEISVGDEVICPSLTFVAGPNSILYVGARPVFADVECVHHPNISPENIESKITEKTKAIQVVHYAGHPCRMELIKEIADRHKLRVIEDCAHAPGALYQGMQCGTMGDIGCFSFFSNKNLTTAEGGMIVTNNKRLARKVRLMRSHGMTTLTMDRYHGTSHSYDVVELGYNYRLDEMRSALGIVQLNRLNEVNRRRHRLAKIYRKRLNACGGITPAFADSDGDEVFHILPAVLDENMNRYHFIEDLRTKGIQTSIHYPPAHLFEIYRRRFGHGKGFLPQTEEFGRREVTLPLYPSMGEETVHHVCDAVEDFFRKGDY